jgi:hypothetical protein
MVKLFESPLATLGRMRRAYVALNLAYYGLVAVSMAYSVYDPSLQQLLQNTVLDAFQSGPLSSVFNAYTGGQVVQAVALTFTINFFVASLASISLPSLIVPFSGFLVAVLRAIMWGLIFAPTSLPTTGASVGAGLLVALLLLLEGQGYVLAMLAAYAQGRAFLFPKQVGATGHAQGYWIGVKQALQIYLLVALVLIVAAIYEVSIAVWLLPRLVA